MPLEYYDGIDKNYMNFCHIIKKPNSFNVNSMFKFY
jgi:hypothetical protein